MLAAETRDEQQLTPEIQEKESNGWRGAQDNQSQATNRHLAGIWKACEQAPPANSMPALKRRQGASKKEEVRTSRVPDSRQGPGLGT